MDPQALSQLAKNIANLQCKLSAPANGKGMYDCSFSSSVQIGADNLTQENRLLIDADTKLPYQLQVNGFISAANPETGELGIMKATIVQTYTYDPALKIDLP